MNELLNKLAICIEKGKINKDSPYPPDLVGQEGADELARTALAEGVSPHDILHKACVVGMENIGEKFKKGQAFVPQLLIAAKAMQSVMNHLQPYFDSGVIRTRGIFVIGTVSGDLHDIGKNLVAMVVGGAGWKIVDLGTDAPPEKFLEAVQNNPDCVVGLSALLTTTLENMEKTVAALKEKYPSNKIIVGGAPVTQDFASKIGADAYAEDPQGAAAYLNALAG